MSSTTTSSQWPPATCSCPPGTTTQCTSPRGCVNRPAKCNKLHPVGRCPEGTCVGFQPAPAPITPPPVQPSSLQALIEEAKKKVDKWLSPKTAFSFEYRNAMKTLIVEAQREAYSLALADVLKALPGEKEVDEQNPNGGSDWEKCGFNDCLRQTREAIETLTKSV